LKVPVCNQRWLFALACVNDMIAAKLLHSPPRWQYVAPHEWSPMDGTVLKRFSMRRMSVKDHIMCGMYHWQPRGTSSAFVFSVELFRHTPLYILPPISLHLLCASMIL